MKLEDVRQLKTEAAEAKRRSGHRLSIALGIAGDGTENGYRLALRIQHDSMQAREMVDTLRTLTAGEIDVRKIGPIRPRIGGLHPVRRRPLQIGSSIGHFAVPAGTLGAFVRRRGKPNTRLILSNNHILANENRARSGDSILQPGASDGGTRFFDRVAGFSKKEDLRPVGNVIDAAYAQIDRGIPHEPLLIEGLGTLNGRLAPAAVGMRVAKLGKSSGLTHGVVAAVELDDVDATYGIGTLSFNDVIEIHGLNGLPFSEGGDSGSLIVDEALSAVALLFAGREPDDAHGVDLTYANPIQAVMDRLDIELPS